MDAFIRRSEQAQEYDAATVAKGRETRDYRFTLPASIREHAAALDAALAGIKICDPAIGSGAFPVGLMHEIVKARTTLTPHLLPLSLSKGPAEDTEGAPLDTTGGRTPYALKRHAIQHSIYGVDIDPGAVDIAKLRLWLSLVVDEDSYSDIQPLPNLDYKIVRGNTLLGFPEKWRSPATERLESLKTRYFSTTDPAHKATLKADIEREIQARLANSEKVFGYAVDFDFRLFFSEVFHQKGGFDVVIGNPPYVRHELIKAYKPALKKVHPQVYQGTADLYVYFYDQGLQVLRAGGFLAFITSNKFMRAGYGKKLRQRLTQTATPHTVIDFGDLPVFDATAYPCIVMVQKTPAPPDNIVSALTVETVPQIQHITQVMAQQAWPMPQQKALTVNGWRLEPPEVLALLDKLRHVGTPLGDYIEDKFYRGILTGYNEAFVIDHTTRNQLIAEDPSSAEVIKPFLRGRDVKRWQVDFAEQYLIKIESSKNVHHSWSGKSETEAGTIFAQAYPAVYTYFEQYREQLVKRYDQGHYFWELRSCAYWEEFEKPKIVYPDIAKRPEFTYDAGEHYLINTLYLIPTDEKWLLGILNSQVIFWFYTKISTLIRGDFVRFIAQYVSQIPIPAPPTPNPIETLVTRILAAKAADPASDVRALEAEIDRHVYQLYGLTDAEIALIEAQTT